MDFGRLMVADVTVRIGNEYFCKEVNPDCESDSKKFFDAYVRYDYMKAYEILLQGRVNPYWKSQYMTDIVLVEFLCMNPVTESIHEAIMEKIMQCTNPNFVGKHEYSLLRTAMEHGSPFVVRLILQQGATHRPRLFSSIIMRILNLSEHKLIELYVEYYGLFYIETFCDLRHELTIMSMLFAVCIE